MPYNEPSRKLDDRSCSPDAFADFFASIYNAEDHIEPSCKEAIRRLPRFSIDELKCALKQMASNRCPDSYGIVCEMVKFAPETFHFKYVELMNAMIDHGCSNDSWRTSLFCMLPKSGDMTLPKITGRLQSCKSFTRSFHG